jgi:hypothetical protein
VIKEQDKITCQRIFNFVLELGLPLVQYISCFDDNETKIHLPLMVSVTTIVSTTGF